MCPNSKHDMCKELKCWEKAGERESQKQQVSKTSERVINSYKKMQQTCRLKTL